MGDFGCRGQRLAGVAPTLTASSNPAPSKDSSTMVAREPTS